MFAAVLLVGALGVLLVEHKLGDGKASLAGPPASLRPARLALGRWAMDAPAKGGVPSIG